MLAVSLEYAIILIIIGVVMVFVGRRIYIEDIVNKVIYVIGAILIFIGIIFLVLALLGVAL